MGEKDYYFTVNFYAINQANALKFETYFSDAYKVTAFKKITNYLKVIVTLVNGRRSIFLFSIH